MAGAERMTIEEVVRKVLREEHGDVIRESVRVVAQELMEAEVSELIGAQRGERTEDRATVPIASIVPPTLSRSNNAPLSRGFRGRERRDSNPRPPA